AKYVLDATELGDLLPLAEVESVSGAESKAETQEPHALDGPAEPENVQGLTWVMALGFDQGGNHTIEKPAQYDRWRSFKPDFWPDRLLSFKMLHVQQGHAIDFPLFGNGSFNLFEYRQIVDPQIYRNPIEAATIANWPQNDFYDDGNIIDKPPEVITRKLEEARQLSLSLLYWLQTEAPRHDGGTGYPELRLRPDLVGTEDGLAQAPYIRESRRIKARFTVLEQHVSTDCNPGRDRAVEFPDSVGVGAYRIDLHPSTNGVNTIDTSTLPFQIPLGSLIHVRMRNLLPAAKNLGVTHITNGCYRLHPIEWNIGESAGLLAGYCIQNGVLPVQVHESPEHTRKLQELCVRQWIEIEWPNLGPL
ncbi:MAG TPA: FAD-dependent oxidoreductase, partial [Fimbriimonadaceae bacterium]|nr:FAD-dependent oxidoreductase [Fimbriimonadaceae bacterium]